MDRSCTVPGCTRECKSALYCSGHYRRVQAHGEPGGPLRAYRRGFVACAVAGCVRPHFARGYCSPHYKRVRAHGAPGGPVVRLHVLGRRCRVLGCNARSAARGYCSTHVARLYRYGSARERNPVEHRAPRRGMVRRVAGMTCAVAGCGRAVTALGMCAAHYWRERTYGDVQAERPVRAACGSVIPTCPYCVATARYTQLSLSTEDDMGRQRSLQSVGGKEAAANDDTPTGRFDPALGTFAALIREEEQLIQQKAAQNKRINDRLREIRKKLRTAAYSIASGQRPLFDGHDGEAAQG